MRCSRFCLPRKVDMLILPCTAPTDCIEPAPLTDLPLHMAANEVKLEAFWVGDEAYCVRAEAADGGQQWYCIEREPIEEATLSLADRAHLGVLMSSVLPLGAGRVAFPTGSSGRVVYRIWRSKGAGAASRTRILGVRAARSRRLPA